MIRLPKSLSNLPRSFFKRPTGAEVLEAEMLGEQAYALGLSARSMKKALNELRSSNGNSRRTQNAADAVHAFFIQREMVGLDNHEHVVEFYDIPNSVLARVGAIDKST